MDNSALVRFMFTYRYEGFAKVEYDIASTEAMSKENRDTRQRQGCSVGEIVCVELPLPKESARG